MHDARANSAPGFEQHPGYSIRLSESDVAATVYRHGKPLLHSKQSILLSENDYPPVIYMPRSAIDPPLLQPSERTSFCPFKGQASYWHLCIDGECLQDAAWSYEDPFDEVQIIKGMIAWMQTDGICCEQDT